MSAPLPAGYHETEADHETELDRLTERGCGTEDDGPGWLQLLVADDAIAERHHDAVRGGAGQFGAA